MFEFFWYLYAIIYHLVLILSHLLNLVICLSSFMEIGHSVILKLDLRTKAESESLKSLLHKQFDLFHLCCAQC